VITAPEARDPELSDLVDEGCLPKERAEGRADEYALVALAMKRLIRTDVDQTRASEVRAKR
jgi:hypothetical protein